MSKLELESDDGVDGSAAEDEDSTKSVGGACASPAVVSEDPRWTFPEATKGLPPELVVVVVTRRNERGTAEFAPNCVLFVSDTKAGASFFPRSASSRRVSCHFPMTNDECICALRTNKSTRPGVSACVHPETPGGRKYKLIACSLFATRNCRVDVACRSAPRSEA